MDLISIRDLEKKEIEKILDLAEDMAKGKAKRKYDKIIATLFFEPSTRTRLSFQSAALRLGMNYIDFTPETSSIKKGETFLDTVKVISGYADILVIRHPKEGAARLAADVVNTPVINGGDGGNQHPTQALIDLFTIRKTKGKIANMNISLAGDLRHARTMQSLVYALAMFGAKITLISPKGLELEPKLVKEIEEKFEAKIKTKSDLSFEDADVLYICRIQEERFADPYEAKRVKEQFMLNMGHLQNAKKDIVILSPLPKINEISEEVDTSDKARYFEQAHYGIPVRMAIIDYVLSN
ncbi:aspartate carbamoyltransferase [Candidatus Micrarchaeota archaeon]|nr:aspartate carbamoyltransferase [Candidatus Micrarchaeota archaeon]